MIFPFREVILKSCDFSGILFAHKLPKAISLVARQISLRSNITRLLGSPRKMLSRGEKANKTAQVSLRTLGQSRSFLIVILFLNGILDVIVDELREGFIGFVLRVQAVGEDLLVLLRPREHIYRLKTVFLGDLL